MNISYLVQCLVYETYTNGRCYITSSDVITSTVIISYFLRLLLLLRDQAWTLKFWIWEQYVEFTYFQAENYKIKWWL